MRKTLLSLSFAALAVPALATAATFEEVDADADGMVSMAEASAAMPTATEEDLAAFDTDGDGMLSPAEFAAMPQQ